MTFPNIFDTVGNKLTGLSFSAKIESFISLTGITFASLRFAGKTFLLIISLFQS